MLRRRLFLLIIFLVGFAMHATMSMALEQRLSVPLDQVAVRVLAIVGLLIAIAAVWLDIADRDEVQRRFALIAAAVSFAATAVLAYTQPWWGGAAVHADSLWSAALLIWLVCFGFLQWRARW